MCSAVRGAMHAVCRCGDMRCCRLSVLLEVERSERAEHGCAGAERARRFGREGEGGNFRSKRCGTPREAEGESRLMEERERTGRPLKLVFCIELKCY